MNDTPLDLWASAPALEAGIAPQAVVERGGAAVRFPDVDPVRVRLTVEALRAAGERLAALPARVIAEALGRVGARFTDPRDPLRKEALAWIPPLSGLTREMAAAVLDGMARDWTGARLAAALDQDLGGAAVLDGFVRRGRNRTMAIGHGIVFQSISGTVPGVGVTALVRSLLVKSPTLVKPGLGDAALPVLFARALREEDDTLADAASVLYWPRDRADLEAVALGESDLVVLYGSDETVEALRARTPVTTRVVIHHHRVSVGIVGSAALVGKVLDHTAGEIATAIAMFDQRGCVSPRLLLVEEERPGDATRLAEALATAFEGLEATLPGGRLMPQEGASLLQLRNTAEMLQAAGREVTVRHGGADSWTVVLDAGGVLGGGGPGRVAVLRPFRSRREVMASLSALGPHLQTVGVSGIEGVELEALATALGRLGASRVARFGAVPFPPPWWRHDGRGGLDELVRWVDLEELEEPSGRSR